MTETSAGPIAFTSDGRVHFVGMGGAGMSAIAKVLIERGVPVSGSDLKRSRALTALEAMGAVVHIGHDGAWVEGASLAVRSSAIPEANPELMRAAELGIPVITRGQALAAVMAGDRAVVVAGTHGKTTTTSMIVSVLRSAQRDPSYLVGGGLNDVGTNARAGTESLVVAESDESDGSFLLLDPHIAVVTNVEADHLDYWGSFDAVRDAFVDFLGRVDPQGVLIVPAGNADLVASARATGKRVVTFGEDGDISAEEIVPEVDGTTFRLVRGDASAIAKTRTRGAHNVSNSLAAAAACLEVEMTLDEVAGGLAEYRGVERRFQTRGRVDDITVVDDYAHHPTEIKATLASTRPGPWERVIAVFQPHRYTRTAHLSREFGASFEGADRVVVTDIYGAGEQAVPGVTGKLIADAVCASLPGRPVAYLPHREELLAFLETNARPGDIFLTLGAGDISTVGEELLQRLEARA